MKGILKVQQTISLGIPVIKGFDIEEILVLDGGVKEFFFLYRTVQILDIGLSIVFLLYFSSL